MKKLLALSGLFFCMIILLTGCIKNSDTNDLDPKADGDIETTNTPDGDKEFAYQEFEFYEPNETDSDNSAESNSETPEKESGIPNPFSCEKAGYSVREFIDAPDSSEMYALAADFTLNTTNGKWNLKDNWTGCESYLFILDSSRQTLDWPMELWDRDLSSLLDTLPDNTHLFFMSDAFNTSTAHENILKQYNDYIATKDENTKNRLYHQIHFVTDVLTDLDNYIKKLMFNPKWGFGIDRFQKIRYIGSYADPTRNSPSKGWFAPNLKMAANEGRYYNFEAKREEKLASQKATIISIFDKEEISDPGWKNKKGYAEVLLPVQSVMDTFDTAELDLYLGCVGDGEYGTCPAWDYIVHLYLCDKDEPEKCNTEIGRWITTYHREGRWVHDITPLLPLLKDSNKHRFAFYTQQKYEVDLKLRLIDSGNKNKPSETHSLFGGGRFKEDYNDKYEPVSIDIPIDATKVELATVITGHGMSSPGNCAEFCNTLHTFTFNDGIFNVSFPQAGSSYGCMDQVNEGTVPNQYGTWWYGRSGWCPGKEVQVQRLDITSKVKAGEPVELTYKGFYRDAPYTGNDANIVMTSWLTIYKAK